MRSETLGYVPAFDGIRGIAVLSVMAFHAGVPFFNGGFLGVDFFFVLSGFLITTLLGAERAYTGTIGLRRFYIRRALRLLPALVFMIGILLLYSLVFVSQQKFTAVSRESLAALFYVTNWAQIAHVIPLGGWLTHTWSLSIEEQFYLTWPLLLLVMTRWLRPSAVLAVVLAAACASAVARALLWDGAESFPRAYVGFDARADVLLIGCLAALVVDRAWIHDRARTGRDTLRTLAVVSALVLGVLVVGASLTDYMYEGAFTIVAIAVAVILLEIRTSPTGPFARALSVLPLVAVGRISYGLYLWHWPIYQVCWSGALGWDMPATTAARFALTFAAATLSYVLVERRFLALKTRWQVTAQSVGG